MLELIAPNGSIFELCVDNNGSLYTKNKSVNLLANMGFLDFHKNGFKGEGVKVAIIESGCGSIDNKLTIVGGYNFINNSSNYNGSSNHTCGVASIIGSKEFGAAPNCEIYCLRIDATIDPENNIQVENALKWCITNKIDVVNISLSLNMTNVDILDECLRNNIIVCVSLPNTDGLEEDSFLVASNGTIVSTNIDEGKIISNASGKSYFVDFALYGTNIKGYNTSGDTVEDLSGSSFANAFLTSMAILLKQKFRDITSEQFKFILINSCEDLGIVGFDKIYGYGVPTLKFINSLPSESDIVKFYKESNIVDGKVIGKYDEILKNQSKKITIEVYPKYAENRLISYKIDDSYVASVDSNGVISGLNIGESKVSVSFENSDVVRSLGVTVVGDSIDKQIELINRKLNIKEIMNNGIDGSGVSVCIIGNGVNNIEGKLTVIDGYKGPFVDGSNSWNNDSNGYGTSGAAVIAHKDYGIAKGASIYSARLIRSDNLMRPADIIGAFEWCKKNYIDIVVMPYSYPASSVTGLKEFIENIVKTTNMIVVATPFVLQSNTVPFGMDKVISVSKIDVNGTPISEGNYNSEYVDCSSFYSLVPMFSNKLTNQLILGECQDVTCCYVAGIIALLKQQDPNLNTEKLKKLLPTLCEDIKTTGVGKDNITGYGLLKAKLII